jgi:hypothetical protein
VRSKQELNTTYEEACRPVISRCRFLLEEVRCVDTPEVLAYQKQLFLSCQTRWQLAVRKVMKDIRFAKLATQRSSRPEDIVNSNIQNMDSHSQYDAAQGTSMSDQIAQKSGCTDKKGIKETDVCQVKLSVPCNDDSSTLNSTISNNKEIPMEDHLEMNLSNELLSSSSSQQDEVLVSRIEETVPALPEMNPKSSQTLVNIEGKTECEVKGKAVPEKHAEDATRSESRLENCLKVSDVERSGSASCGAEENKNNFSSKLDSQQPPRKHKKSRKRLIPDSVEFKQRFSNLMTFVTGTGPLGVDKLSDVETVRQALLTQVI